MIDPHSDTWRFLKQKLSDGLEEAREQLESMNHDQRRSDFLRGKIALHREILELGKAASAKGKPPEMPGTC